jgi:predicted AAA+ superfamily ATPase
MKRYISDFLDEWLNSSTRKPLILRGARQVGKTWLVRDLAIRHSLQLIELNLEQFPEYADHFSSNDPKRVIADLEADLGITIIPKKTLLFLDEIQSTPKLLAFLRWFYEDMPQLPVIAAGSLLEFTLKDHNFSMPVGRVEYCHVEPISFYEFLDASGNGKLKSSLEYTVESGDLNIRLHNKALNLFGIFCLIGGLPEITAKYISENDITACMKLQRNLIAAYQDDFNKYRGRISIDTLRHTMESIPYQLSNRFIYNEVKSSARHRDIKQSMQLLELARICHKIEHTASNGLPLGAETNDKLFKTIFLDIGLVSAQLGLSILELSNLPQVIWANKGALAEQFIGQHLRCISPSFENPRLFYWQRTNGRQGEIDYVIQSGTHIIPIEVKAGTAGSMKSLHAFMHNKKLKLAIRFDTNPPSNQNIDVKTTTGEPAKYHLISLPLYMVESLPNAISYALS